ncbi:MAG: hypothetical protein HYZ32_00175, partial [Hydrocarboniphaga effusa]|nr:hypothetical protein [Hydrocarboniphaga effusa]
MNPATTLGDPIERNLSAGEYVLGTLTAEERRELEAEAGKNTVLRHEIARWERQLAGFGLRLKPVAPRPMVWLNLSYRLGVTAVSPMPARDVLWKTWAGLATAASLALAFGLYRELERPLTGRDTATQRVVVPMIRAKLRLRVVHSPDPLALDRVLKVEEGVDLTIGRAGNGASFEIDDGFVSRRHV